MKEIKLTKGKVAIVDDDDYLFLKRFNWSYYLTNTGEYATIQIKNATIYMHQLILPATPNKYALHKNKNTLDNRKENLQLVTVNHRRHIGLKKQIGASVYRGVQRLSKNKWRVVVSKDKVRYYGGDFKIEDEKLAALKYNELAKKLYGEFAYQNKV